MNRSEPQILADLIRLQEQNERRFRDCPHATLHIKSTAELEAENELLEQARAALHQYVSRSK